MDGFLISYMTAMSNQTLPLTNIPKVCLLLVCQGFAWQQILLRLDATLLDSSECDLQHYVFRHYLNYFFG
jgi:hypothetical protein